LLFGGKSNKRMSKEYTLSFLFDSRRKKGKNTFPIKLKAIPTPPRLPKKNYVGTGYYFTEAE